MVAVFLTDPEHKTPVGRGRAVNDRAMWDMWRDQHDISEMDRVNFGSDLNADITFHKKTKIHNNCGNAGLTLDRLWSL